MAESTWLDFEELEAKPKTRVFAVKAKQSGARLGRIAWYAPWRRYGYFVETPGFYDATCLNDLAAFSLKLMEKHGGHSKT